MHLHTNNSKFYDDLYSREFGRAMSALTRRTLDAIESEFAPCSVIDFGAGTGRLTVPLAEVGYTVTAVDPCQPMLDQLTAKLPADSDVNVICSTAQSYHGDDAFELALMVFTVVSYLLDDEALDGAFTAAAAALSPGGSLLMDVPCKAAFSSRNNPVRKVSVVPIGGDLYRYTEKGLSPDQDYCEDFEIRYWPESRVLEAAQAAGFAEAVVLSGFTGSGATYFQLTKAA